MEVLFEIEVRGPLPMSLWVELECYDLLLPVGSKVAVCRVAKNKSTPAMWAWNDENGTPRLTVFPEFGNELFINGVSVHECWKEYDAGRST